MRTKTGDKIEAKALHARKEMPIINELIYGRAPEKVIGGIIEA